MNAPTSDPLQNLIDATRRQIESLGRKLAEHHPGNNKVAWSVAVLLKDLERLELQSALAYAKAKP